MKSLLRETSKFKTFRRFIVIGLVLIQILILAACGKRENTDTSGTPSAAPTQSAKGDREITFWLNKYGGDPALQDAILTELTNEFYEKTGIRVKYSIIDWDQSLTKLTLASTGGECPDVYDIYFTASLLQMGDGKYGPAEIDDVIADLGADNYSEAGKSEVYHDGHWYGVPWRADTRILLYNKEYFKEAGIEAPPKNWDELMNFADRLTVRDNAGNIERSGLLWNVGNGRFDQTWKCLLEGAGGSILSEDYTKAAFNSDAGRDTLAMMRRPIDEYNVMPATCIDPSFDPIAEFMAGKAAMVLGVGSSVKRNIATMAPQIVDAVGGAVIPSKDGTGNSSVASAASFALMRGSKDPEAAKEFLRFLGSTEIMTRWTTTINMLNCNEAVMADPYFSEDEWLSVFGEQMKLAGPMDQPVASFSQMDAWPNGPLPKLVTDVMAGVDIQTAIEEAEAGVNKLLSE